MVKSKGIRPQLGHVPFIGKWDLTTRVGMEYCRSGTQQDRETNGFKILELKGWTFMYTLATLV
jgi:hypothetical protein